MACALVGIAAAAAAEDTAETGTFGKDGIATQSLGVHYEETNFSSVEARPDGGLVALRGDQLEAYLADGAPDPAFPSRRVAPSRRVYPLAGGKSLVDVDVFGDSQLTRVNPDGNADPSFGDGGAIRVPVGVQAATELPSGKIVIAGVFSGGTHELVNRLEVALVNPDGSLSQGVGSSGVLGLQLPSNTYVGGASAILPTGDDGALIVGGTFLLQLRADGSPDPDYGSAGLVTGLPTTLVGGRILADGSLEAVGSSTRPSDQDLIALRYTGAGRPDTGFGADGIRSFDLGGDEQAHDASWAADGSVVVGGSSLEVGACGQGESCREVPILAALDPDGSLDPGFGDAGVLRLASLTGDSRTGSTAASPAWRAGRTGRSSPPVSRRRSGPSPSSPLSRRGERCSPGSATAGSCACGVRCGRSSSSAGSPAWRAASCSPPAPPTSATNTRRS